MLAEAFGRGCGRPGADVVAGGLGSTDMLYYASGSLGIPGAMITASHNPPKYNGIKLCRAGRNRSGGHRARRTAGCGRARGARTPGPPGTIASRDLLPGYAAFLKSLVDLSGMRPLKIVADAGNGMAGHTVPEVFAGLPVTVVPLYFELDGTFPNHEANPIDPANLADLQRAVAGARRGRGAGLRRRRRPLLRRGRRAQIVSPSAITALIAARELAREPGATIIHNLITSRAVPEIIAEHGGKPVRTRVGHSFIKARMAETGAVFGGEHSGHFYFRDFWFADSGMLAALHVLAALGGADAPLSQLLAGYGRYVASGEINSEVGDQRARPRRSGGPSPAALVSDGRHGRADRDAPGLVVQRPPVEHRAAAAAQRRSIRPTTLAATRDEVLRICVAATCAAHPEETP